MEKEKVNEANLENNLEGFVISNSKNNLELLSLIEYLKKKKKVNFTESSDNKGDYKYEEEKYIYYLESENETDKFLLENLKNFLQNNKENTNKIILLLFENTNKNTSESSKSSFNFDFIELINNHNQINYKNKILVLTFGLEADQLINYTKNKETFCFNNKSIQSFYVSGVTTNENEIYKSVLNNLVVINQINDNPSNIKMYSSFLNKKEFKNLSLSFVGEYFTIKRDFSNFECMFSRLDQLQELPEEISTNNGFEFYIGEYNIFGRNGRGKFFNTDNYFSTGLFEKDLINGIGWQGKEDQNESINFYGVFEKGLKQYGYLYINEKEYKFIACGSSENNNCVDIIYEKLLKNQNNDEKFNFSCGCLAFK